MDILACPHCQRLFRASEDVLGKKIRCRGCREVFHVPRDTTVVPLGPMVDGLDAGNDPGPPVAIACVVEGRDARRCPGCGREFLMKATFAGKVIRCRGCKSPFRVAATEPGAALPQPSRAGPPAVAPPQVAVPGARPGRGVRPAAATSPRPTIFEDMGDVLGDVRPGERVASVVRPRKVAVVSRRDAEAVGFVAAIVLGGVCAVPIFLGLLRIISAEAFERVAAGLPNFLTAWLR